MNSYIKEIAKIKSKPEINFLSIRHNRINIKLVPVISSQENIKLIAKWRKNNADYFLTKFKVTEFNTKKRIDYITNDSEKVLFFILINGEKIGHVGILDYNKKNNSAEIGNVLKAVKIKSPRVMEVVLGTLLRWMFSDLKLSKIYLEVFSDNFRAINLYERSGMKTIESVPLKKISKRNGWQWKKVKLIKKQLGQRYLNIMEISKNDFIKNFLGILAIDEKSMTPQNKMSMRRI